ncbi:MAG: hypothetical protein Q4D93_01165 [Porphyromonas sp.]|nr:hypothetical protein [Porphyromonas sp.]
MALLANNGIRSTIYFKIPGNPAQEIPLTLDDCGRYRAETGAELPVEIQRTTSPIELGYQLEIEIQAKETVYFSFSEELETGINHEEALFYLPGFWYRHNLRSPKEAPSFHTSDSWLFREDRLSTPLTTVFSPTEQKVVAVMRLDNDQYDALTTHNEGEVILSGKTSIGYTGFINRGGKSSIAYGFPYREAPTTYLRKLTLAPPVQAFQKLPAGSSIVLKWHVTERPAVDFADCVAKVWQYSYDTNKPQPLEDTYSVDFMKETLSQFFTQSLVREYPIKYYSGVELTTAMCEHKDLAEVGFVGRTLLNAFNALEYGEEVGNATLVSDAREVIDSYLQHGFGENGLFREVIQFERGREADVLSIRRQSEATYAILSYLNYERHHGRRHPEWEHRVRAILDTFLRIQNKDGSFPRKFRYDLTVVDETNGGTPSAVLPLVMAYKYFGEPKYLKAAKLSGQYLEDELISKSDYFSSTLDANCEDKEASLYVATATYYLALVSKGKERQHYVDLTRNAAYFAASWYYTWDVPFAEGQMLGDLGLKSRGWGNVSVENNHIDVFVFQFADVLRWLSRESDEPRFADLAEVISTSMRQLLPFEGHMCGIGKVGYYPEVVQHTNWDYGRNGKGFYNDIFAPGWTVASLWDLLTPARAERFLEGK